MRVTSGKGERGGGGGGGQSFPHLWISSVDVNQNEEKPKEKKK